MNCERGQRNGNTDISKKNAACAARGEKVFGRGVGKRAFQKRSFRKVSPRPAISTQKKDRPASPPAPPTFPTFKITPLHAQPSVCLRFATIRPRSHFTEKGRINRSASVLQTTHPDPLRKLYGGKLVVAKRIEAAVLCRVCLLPLGRRPGGRNRRRGANVRIAGLVEALNGRLLCWRNAASGVCGLVASGAAI